MKNVIIAALSLQLLTCQPEGINYKEETEVGPTNPIEYLQDIGRKQKAAGVIEVFREEQKAKGKQPHPKADSGGLKDFFGSAVRVAGVTAKFVGKVILAAGEVAQEQEARKQGYIQEQMEELNNRPSSWNYLTNIEPVVGGAYCYYANGTVTKISGSSNCPRRN